MNWRSADAADLRRLWPAARSSGVAASRAEFEALAAMAPWRIRANDAGDGMVLQRWRAHLEYLSLRAAWAPARRTAALVSDAKELGRAHGYTHLLSPLVAHSAFEAYAEAGMELAERIVAYQGTLLQVARSAQEGQRGVSLRAATARDVASLASLDAACFDEFWRYGAPELESVLAVEHVILAEVDGCLAGYATTTVRGSSATLGRLAVHTEHRRRGVGITLVADAASWARTRGALGLAVCTQLANEAARSLYGSAGLVEVREEYAIGVSRLSGAQLSG
jgi:GNAT superfamily N-acetyltransferase